MRYLPLFVLSFLGVVVVSAASAQYLHTWSAIEAERAAGRQLFADHCAACHAPQSDSVTILAPSLRGVVGRRAGSVAGFPYSEALKKSNIVWTEDNLRKWIADSKRMIPDTLMPHASLGDPAEQLYVVVYLKSLKSPGR